MLPLTVPLTVSKVSEIMTNVFRTDQYSTADKTPSTLAIFGLLMYQLDPRLRTTKKIKKTQFCDCTQFKRQ